MNFTILSEFGLLDFCVLTIGVICEKQGFVVGLFLVSHGQPGTEYGRIYWFTEEKLVC